MRRILPDELHLGQIRACCVEPCSPGTRWASQFRERALIIANNPGVQAGLLKWLAVILPVHAEVQSEIGTELPFVFEICADLALHLSEVFCGNLRRPLQCCVLGAL